MTDVMLANQALRLAKLTKIDSLDDSNENASYLKDWFPEHIKEILGEHHWNFAKRTKQLTELNIDFNQWDYVFDLPDDMVHSYRYYPTGYDYNKNFLSTDQFEVFGNTTLADAQSERVATNEADLSLVYTKYIREIPYFPREVADALSYLMAYYLATSFGGAERAAWAYQMYTDRKLPYAIGKDHDMQRDNIQGVATLLTDDIIDPWNYR